MQFKPFSLAEAVQAGQNIKMNQMKMQAYESQQAKEREIRSIAQMSQKPTYDDYEQPDEQMFPGEAPIQGLQEQTGTEYDPQANIQGLQEAGHTKEAADMAEQYSKLTKSQQEEAKYKAEEFGKLILSAKGNPEMWDRNSQIALERGFITPEQVVPYSDEAWQNAYNASMKMTDLTTGGSQRGVSTTLQELNYLNSLPPEKRAKEKAEMMELKGRGKIKLIAGVPHIVGQDGSITPLSTQEGEIKFKEQLKARETAAVANTKAKIKEEWAAQKDINKAEVEKLNVDNMVRETERLLDNINWSTAGFIGTMVKYVPGTDAANLKSSLITLRANIGFKAISLMKEQSATGATGLGQVAVPEFEALQGALANLEQSQSPSRLRENGNVVLKRWAAYEKEVLKEEKRAQAALRRKKGEKEPTEEDQAEADYQARIKAALGK